MEKERLKGKIAVWSFILSVIFGVAGLVLPPTGEISPSVLIYIAQMLVFTAMLLGFSASENAVLKEISEILRDIKK